MLVNGLALGLAQNLTEQQVLTTFITGYEIMVRQGGIGTQRIGRNLQRSGFHPIANAARAAMLKRTPHCPSPQR